MRRHKVLSVIMHLKLINVLILWAYLDQFNLDKSDLYFMWSRISSNWLGTYLTKELFQKIPITSSFDLMFDRLGNERVCRCSWYRARVYVNVRWSRARCGPTVIFSNYQCLYSGYRFGRWMVACSWWGCGVGTGALAILGGSSLVELLGDG